MRLSTYDRTTLILTLTLLASVVAHAGVHYRLGVLAKEQALALALAREAAEGARRSVLEFDLSEAARSAPPEVRPSTSAEASTDAPEGEAAPENETEEARQARERARREALAQQPEERARREAAQLEVAEPEPEPEPEPELALPTPPTPQAPPPPPTPEEARIAVRQHSQNPDDPPPETVYIADENNTVEEETVAEVTNLDRDDVETSVGAAMERPSEPSEAEGNADDERLAESEDVEGSEERRPTPEEVTRRPRERPVREARAEGRTESEAPPDARAERSRQGDGMAGSVARREEAQRGRAGGGAPEAGGAASVIAGTRGDWSMRREGSLGAGGGDGAGGLPTPERRGREGAEQGARGRARSGQGPGERAGRTGPDLTLRYSQLVDIVGEQRLTEEREAHFREQRSRIRGTSSGARWEQFRAALENYMPSVRPGSQTALNAARSPFATYIARIHDRVHQTYHGFVEGLPLEPRGPFADPNLRTLLEIVLNRDGSVHRVGVVRSSGLSMFDYGAYNAVMRGQPYPVAPDAILSGDGRVYMHWDFHRQQPFCHQSHARPYILPHLSPTPDQAPGQRLEESTVVPRGARANFGAGGGAASEGDDEDDDDEDDPDAPGGAAARPTAAPRAPLSRGPRL